MHLSLIRRLVVFAFSAGGFAVVLGMAGLLVGWSRSDGLVRYPGAERVAAMHFRLDTLPKGYILQHSTYRTADDLPAVLGWHVRHFGLGQEYPKTAMGSCLTLTNVDAQLFLQHALAITLCSRPNGTLVFVNRSLAICW